MIEAATRRRLLGDWRGACVAADVELFFDPDAVRRRYGCAVAESLRADLRSLAPDLLRWQLPRCGHGAGHLLEGLLLPLAEYVDAGRTLTLAAATPGFALAAGQRIVLTVLDGKVGRDSATYDTNPAMRTLLEAVHQRSVERYDLRRHRMFWDAASAAELRGLCTADSAGAEGIDRLQDEGRAIDAWNATGFDVSVGVTKAAPITDSERHRLARWFATVPVNLPHLAGRIRDVYPDADGALIRCGSGAIALSGFEDDDERPRATVLPLRSIRSRSASLPTVPEAAWARPLDVDLLRLGLLEAHELHPLVASALKDGSGEPAAIDEWRYTTTLGIEAQYAESVEPDLGGRHEILVRCGADLHRVARLGGRWQAIDHDDHAARETLLARLGGPMNPCRSAAQRLGSGSHVIELVARLLEHGRATEATRLLHEHADTVTLPEDYALPDGSTVGQVLDALRENTLRLRMIRAGAPPVRDCRSTRIHPSFFRARRFRKGDPAGPKIPR
jgi:hypothetical protein